MHGMEVALCCVMLSSGIQTLPLPPCPSSSSSVRFTLAAPNLPAPPILALQAVSTRHDYHAP